MPMSRRWRSTRGISRFRRSIRSGPTAPPSGAGSRCRPAARSTPPIRTHGFFPSGRGSGRSSPSKGSASRRASWSGRRTANGSMRPMRGARTGAARSLCRRAASAAPGRSAAGKSHTIPGVNDCKACHQGGRSEVLGFGLIQLSPDRDPGALHADLRRRREFAHRARPARWLAAIRARGALDRSVRDRARGRRLPARQLRALPQRAGPVAQSRALPAPDRR